MSKHHSNLAVLQDYVEHNKLRDNHSNVHFNCGFKIKTAKNYENVDCTARITFNEYDDEGIVSVICDLDPDFFPTVFKAKWNDMEFEDDILTINDTHRFNSDIGKYKAIITAYEKTR